MKRYFFFSLVSAAFAGLTLFASCNKDDDKDSNQQQSATEGRIVKVETLYGIEDYPYDRETTYEYDAQGRVTKRSVTTGKGTVDEYSYSFSYSYSENQIVCTSTYNSSTTLNLEGGLVRSEVLSYGGDHSQINYEYDADNHIVREIYSEGDTVFHVWQNGNLMRTYTHKHSSHEVGAYDITTDYTFTDYSYDLFPFSDCGTGENALATKGFYGAQPKNLPATDQYLIKDEVEVSGHDAYTYTLDEKGRVKSIAVKCESLPYTIRITWSN